MKIAGKIIDAQNKEPLPSASITVTDGFYAPLGPGTTADGEGKFELDHPALDSQHNLVIVSFVGYGEAVLSPQQANGEIALSPANNMMKEFVFTAKKRIGQIKRNNTWYYAACAATVIGAVSLIYRQVK